MPRKTSAPSSELQREVFVRVDFYRCQERDDHVRFEETLGKAKGLPQNERTLSVSKKSIILCELSESDGLFEGEIALLRMTETPALGNLQGQISELPLAPDQGLAERTAFLFDPASQVLAIHAVREAVSAGRLAGYCDVVAATADGFVFEPILRKDTLSDFNHLQAIRKVEVKIASVGAASKAPATARTSVKNYLKLREVAALEAETMTITVGMGRERRRGMAMNAARSLVLSLLDHKEELTVETLIVSGKGGGDEVVALDLLRGRIREDITIKVRGRTASYNQRRDALREAYRANHSIIVS